MRRAPTMASTVSSSPSSVSSTSSSHSRPVVFSMTTMDESGMRLLHDAAEVRMASALDQPTLQREIGDAEAVVIRTGGSIDAPLMDCAPKLKVVGRHGVGVDAIDIPA